MARVGLTFDLAFRSRPKGRAISNRGALWTLGLVLGLALSLGSGAGVAHALSIHGTHDWNFSGNGPFGWFQDAPSHSGSFLPDSDSDHVFPPGCGIAWAPGCDHATQKTEHAGVPWFWDGFPGFHHFKNPFEGFKSGEHCFRPPPPVPEPGTVALLALGLGGLLVGARGRHRAV